MIKQNSIKGSVLCFLLILLNSCMTQKQLQKQAIIVDITDKNIEIVPEFKEDLFQGEENIEKLCDNDPVTKYLTKNNSARIVFKSSSLNIVTSYTITTANDAPKRDPKDWIFEGSLDGKTYHLLDKRKNVNWTDRNEKRRFDFTNTSKFRYYRMKLKNHGLDAYGSDYLQLAELEIFGIQQIDIIPIADFTADKTVIVVGDKVIYHNVSEHSSTAHWTFEGGEILTGNDGSDPIVQYNKEGLFDVSLEVIDDKQMSDVKSKSNYIMVKRDHSPWGGFIAPEVRYQNENRESEGSVIYHKLVSDPEQYISRVGEYVCRHIFNNAEEINDPVRILNYKIRGDMEPGIPSYLSGAGAVTGIDFSSDHVASVYKQTKDDVKVEAEIYGVLFHEMTHGYQLKGEGSGEYDGKSEGWAFMEGLADAVRIRAGFHQDSRPYAAKKRWLEGYTGTGYFYNWLVNNKDDKFLIKLNLSARTVKPWSFDKACWKILGSSADSLWQEYVTKINEGSKPVVKFSADKNVITAGDYVQFTNTTKGAFSYDWTFEGGEPTKSYDKNTTIKYNRPGRYTVTLVAHNKCAKGPGIKVDQKYITVK